jgi:hypothetical protein
MSDRGTALILVMLVMLTLSSLAMALAVMVSTESRVAANYRDGIEVLYGAEAALERVLLDLAAETDVNRLLSGAAASSFTDGPPGERRLPDGTFANLHTLTGMLNCGRAVCGDADLNEVREGRPWGANNPRWQLYGYGASTLLEGSGASSARFYAMVWIADDPSETDMNPYVDGADADSAGLGRLSLTAHAYGYAGTRRIIEATVFKNEDSLRVLSWRESR